MKKILQIAITLMISSIAYGDKLDVPNSEPIYKIGSLELINEFDIASSEFESGKVSKSIDAKIIKETTSIKHQVGDAFGVIIENLSPTKIKATWTYPTFSGATAKSLYSTYAYPERSVSKRHFIYWQIDKGEKEGKYKLDITFNDKLVRTITFFVYK